MSLPRMINDQPDNPRLVSFSNSLALVLQLLPSSAPGDVVMCRCRLHPWHHFFEVPTLFLTYYPLQREYIRMT